MKTRRAVYSVQIMRSTYCDDEVNWTLCKSWWWVGKGGQRVKMGSGTLVGIPEGMSEPEIVRLALESVVRHVFTMPLHRGHTTAE